MGTTKLAVYNLALGHLRERKLASLSENREPRRVLDDFWDQVAAECLAEATWRWAIRTVALESSSSMTPSFGFSYAFQKPDDWVRTHELADEETFRLLFTDWRDEGGFWLSNSDPLYARFVSNLDTYGSDLSLWPANYIGWVGLHLAEYAAGRIAGGNAKELLEGPQGIIKRAGRAKLKAKSTDAMNEGPQKVPLGTWSRSRLGAGRIQTPGGDRFDD